MSWAMVSLLPDRRSVPPTRGRFNTRAGSFVPLARGLLPLLVHERPRRRDEAPPTMSGPRSHGLRGFPPPSGGRTSKIEAGDGYEASGMSTREALWVGGVCRNE